MKRFLRKYLLLPAFLSLAAPCAALAAADPVDPPSPKPQLLVIGAFHMASPGRDVANMKVDDMLAPKRQREIEQVADAIARFRPTKIAVEWPRGKQAELDRDYEAYKAGQRALKPNEIDQLAMRLAKRFGQRQLYAIELTDGMPPVQVSVIDYVEGAKRVGREDELNAMRGKFKALVGEMDEVLRERSVGATLYWFNSPAQLDRLYRTYFDYARIARGDDTPGANWLQFWYGRNLKIHGNLTQIAEPGDRILVVYGASHAPYLRQFGQDSGYFEVLDPLPFLTTDASKPASGKR